VVLVAVERAVLDEIKLCHSPHESLTQVPVPTSADDGCKRICPEFKGGRNTRWPWEKDSLIDVFVSEPEEGVPEECRMLG